MHDIKSRAGGYRTVESEIGHRGHVNPGGSGRGERRRSEERGEEGGGWGGGKNRGGGRRGGGGRERRLEKGLNAST